MINQETLATGAPGIFAAGDVTYGPRSIIHAAAHGRKAARSIHAYLRKRDPAELAEMPDDEVETRSQLPMSGQFTIDIRPTPRAIMPLRLTQARQERTAELANGFTEEQARHEASRCLRCDLAYRCPTIHTITNYTTEQEEAPAARL